MGTQPKTEEIPLDISDFVTEVQKCIEIYFILPGQFEGMAGTYLGKNFSIIEFLFNLFEIEDKKQALYYLKKMDNVETDLINKKIKNQKPKTTHRKK